MSEQIINNNNEWTSVNLAEWLQNDPPEVEYLFRDVFPRGIVAGLGGGGGVGKSTLSLHLAYSLALGRTIFPSFVPCKPVSVMIALGEDERTFSHARFKDMERRYPLTADEVSLLHANLHIYPSKAAPLFEYRNHEVRPSAHFAKLQEEVARREPGLLILDPKSRWSGLNENRNETATAFVEQLELLLKPFNGSALVTHHVAKSQRNALDVASVRGASGFPDATRLFANVVEARIPNLSESPVMQLKFTKSNYTQRSRGCMTFRRSPGFGSALEEIDHAAEDEIRKIACAIAEWVETNGAINKSAIRDARDDRAKALRAHLRDTCGSYRSKLDEVLTLGESEAIFGLQEVTTGGCAATQVVAIADDTHECAA